MYFSLENLIELLGKNKDDPIAIQFIHDISVYAHFEDVEGAYYCILKEHGLDLACDRNRNIVAIMLHADGYENYAAFKGEIPCKLTFSMSRAEVRNSIGPPQKNHDGYIYRGENVPRWDRHDIPPWDRYEYGTWSVHLTYSQDLSKIEMITIDQSGLPERGSVSERGYANGISQNLNN